MNQRRPIEALLDELWLDADELCRMAGVDPPWLQQRVAEGLIPVQPIGPGDAWRFNALTLHRVRRMVCLERDFEAAPELAALVADLEDEIRTLRQRLHQSL